jgi:hypothetical protein
LNTFCQFTCCFASHPIEVSIHPLHQPYKFCRSSFPASSDFLLLSIRRHCYCPHFFLSLPM